FFFFQAEDGIRDLIVTGVQTCALPIYDADRTLPGGAVRGDRPVQRRDVDRIVGPDRDLAQRLVAEAEQLHRLEHRRMRFGRGVRSEERRVGKECRCGWWAEVGGDSRRE